MSPSLLLANDDSTLVDSMPIDHAKPRVISRLRGKKASVVMHRSLLSDPHCVVATNGHFIHLDNGQTILDATGGAAVACIGHSNER